MNWLAAYLAYLVERKRAADEMLRLLLSEDDETARRRVAGKFARWEEDHAHPLALADETAVTRAERRAMVEALCREMSARFVRRERAS